MYADEEFRCGRVCHPHKAIFKTDSVSLVAIMLPEFGKNLISLNDVCTDAVR